MFSSNLKNDINNCNNVSKQQYIDEKSKMQSAESAIKNSIKKEDTWKNNENVNHEKSIVHERIEIKEELVKDEPEFDTFPNDSNSIREDGPSEMVEFVEMQNIKIEKLDECDEDSIKINEGTFICNNCKASFTSTESYQEHIQECTARTYKQLSTSATAIPEKKPRLTNIKEKIYQCDKCSNKFKTEKLLYRHLRSHRRHSCTECQKQFPTPSSLAIHQLTHTGERPHKCTQCEARFNTAGNLKVHMLTHTGARPHKCTECGQSFTQSSDLTRHIRIHTGDRPYQCLQCSKTFTESGKLTRHVRIHTGERPYHCTECSKTFIVSTALNRHMKIHTGEKPYKCTICSHAFVQSNNLKDHMKTHANKQQAII